MLESYSAAMTQKTKKPEDIKLPKIFDKKPELKRKLQERLAKIPEKTLKESEEKIRKYLSGELSWAEIKGHPQAHLKEIARVAYMKFKKGEYDKAEALFKGLSVYDHKNWYYRLALGAIYQKQKIYDRAIEEYDKALMLNQKEIASLANRGECFLKLENYQEALKNFESAIQLDPEGKNAWANRARALKKKLVDEGHEESLGPI